MSTLIHQWIIGLAGAAVITVICKTITPEGKTKKTLTLICGFVLLIALVRPFVSFDYDSFTINTSRFSDSVAAFSEDITQANKNITKRLIEERFVEYIISKGKEQGLEIAACTTRAEITSDEVWYLASALIVCNQDSGKRGELRYVLERDFGLDPAAIIWADSPGAE
ncbi:MAG: hypothetical protein LBO63_04645 [Oscillospiraceae bacterium]|jgi:hypothetical protein|nr:hypothetical protein [Oscillospiraceae bacterium]